MQTSKKNYNAGLAGIVIVLKVHKIKPNLNRINVCLNPLFVKIYTWQPRYSVCLC